MSQTPPLDDVRRAVQAAIDAWRPTTPWRDHEDAGASFTTRKTRRDVRVEMHVFLDHGGPEGLDETHVFPANTAAEAIGRMILTRLVEIERASYRETSGILVDSPTG